MNLPEHDEEAEKLAETLALGANKPNDLPLSPPRKRHPASQKTLAELAEKKFDKNRDRMLKNKLAALTWAMEQKNIDNSRMLVTEIAHTFGDEAIPNDTKVALGKMVDRMSPFVLDRGLPDDYDELVDE